MLHIIGKLCLTQVWLFFPPKDLLRIQTDYFTIQSSFGESGAICITGWNIIICVMVRLCWALSIRMNLMLLVIILLQDHICHSV